MFITKRTKQKKTAAWQAWYILHAHSHKEKSQSYLRITIIKDVI